MTPEVLEATAIHRAAEQLRSAEASQVPTMQLSVRYPRMQAADAYAVQLENIRHRTAQGAHVVGYKIGLTSMAMQQMMQVETPDYGHLLDDMFVSEPNAVDTTSLIQPRVEPELAFVLGRDLPTRPVTIADIWRATDFVLPCLEVIDSRYAGWQITFVDTVADNASSARVIIGGRPCLPSSLSDLAGLGVVLRVNGHVLETGALGAVLRNPANAVAWLATELAAHGVRMHAGDIVLSGSPTRAVDVQAGDHVEVSVESVGNVSARFS